MSLFLFFFTEPHHTVHIYYEKFARLLDEAPTISRLFADRAIVLSSYNIDFLHPIPSFISPCYASKHLHYVYLYFRTQYSVKCERTIFVAVKLNVGSRMKQRSRYNLSQRGSIFISPGELFISFFSFFFSFLFGLPLPVLQQVIAQK